jgi:serralysin
MPLIDVILNGAFDTRSFFAPDTTPITAITGTDTMVTVTLQGGLTLAYTGTGLQFTGTAPTAGQITKVQVLRPDGSEAARMDLTPAPWNFAEITTDAPFQSYLANPHRQLYDFPALQSFAGNTYFEGGNQADTLGNFFGVDTLLGGGGDDVFNISGNVYPTRAAPAGLIVDGGDGNDSLFISSSISADFSQASIRNFETLSVGNGTLTLSGAQLGAGGIALTTNIVTGTTSSPNLIFNQTAGRAVDLSQFGIAAQLVQGTRIQVNGTAGDDVQRGNAHSGDLLLGGDGNDRLYGGGGKDQLFGGVGDDLLVAGDDPAGLTQVFNDPFGLGEALFGGDGNDRIYGGNSDSQINGDAGDDRVFGGTGLTFVRGGDGNDYLVGASGTFPGFGGSLSAGGIAGGAGNDTLISAVSNATYTGDSGDDRYSINHAVRQLTEATGGGTDLVVTTVSLDLTNSGEIERITVAATTGLSITGTATANIITANLGADTLNGGAGDDRMAGQDGADVLNGGLGNDRLTGGLDADLFVFDTGSQRDVITDFADGLDRIDISNLMAVTDFADLQANHLRQSGANVVLNAGGGDVLVIRSITLAQLDAGDFLI